VSILESASVQFKAYNAVRFVATLYA